jgi:nitrous oxidase accessory protein NosD
MMNITSQRNLLVGVLAAAFALTLALVAGADSASAESSVVGPGESIQKAINAADPGDTIVVRGLHHEDVAIRKNGIKLRGDDAVIKPPAKADSPCAPEAICILGEMNFQTGEITGPRVSDVSVSGFTIRGFREREQGELTAFAIDVLHARNATVAGNRAIDNTAGIGLTSRSINTTIAGNDLIGNPNSQAAGINVEDSSNTTIAKNTVRNFPRFTEAIDLNEATNTTIAGNDLIGNWIVVIVTDSPGTKVLSNDINRFSLIGTYVRGQKSQDAKVVGNDISGGPWGLVVENAHGGSVVGNNVHDNCAGIFFEDFASQPVGGFQVKGNTVEDNTRSCRAEKFDINFSGIGIALLGATDMEVTGNHLSGNVPSGPTRISGGVVVSTDPYYRGTTFGGTTKPKNNSVIGNHFGRNKPDIFWEGSGSGNIFRANYCDTSVPTRLCN